VWQSKRKVVSKKGTATVQARSDILPSVPSTDIKDTTFDQRQIVLDDEKYEGLLRLLDETDPPSERLNRLMTKKPLWEK
jgi:uncharacterized protein (DUF1778 family)